jgi:MFS superfamily sulfate permease-like transporter
MISLTALLLGLINVAIVVAVLVLVGYLVVWIFQLIGFAIPPIVQKLYMIVVALIALYMIVALLLGHPAWKIVGSTDFDDPHYATPNICKGC